MKKFFLVTIKGRRYINERLTELSTGVYELDCSDFNFESFEVDGVRGDSITTPVVIGDDLYSYYYNSITRKLQIRLNLADLNFKKNFIVNFVVALTNTIDLSFNIDPDSPNTRKIPYEARISTAPKFNQSQENNLIGLLSLSSSSIAVENTDRALNKLFTEDDSFSSTDIKAWVCTDSVDDREVVYKGTITGVEGDEVLTFGTRDSLERLDNVLYSRGSYEQSIASGLNITIAESQKLYPVYRIYGRNSSFKYKYEAVTSEINQKVLDADGMPLAICSYNNTVPDETSNRLWIVGRINDINTIEEVYTVQNAFVVGTGGGTTGLLLIMGGDEDNFSIGDTFQTSNGEYGRVVETELGGMYVSPASLNITAGVTLKTAKVSALVMRVSGIDYYLHYLRDYTISIPLDYTGVLSIVLNNGLESSLGIGRAIDPLIDNIAFKMRNSVGKASYNHAAQIKSILLEEFGADEIDSASFTSSGISLDLNLCFMVPLVGQDFPTKKDIVEKLTSSSFGYLFIADDFKIGYGNFKTPEPTLKIDDVPIKNKTITHSIDYKDVYQTVTFNTSEFTDVFSVKSELAQYLHRTNKTKVFEHLCDIVSINKPIELFKRVGQAFSSKRIITQMSIYETDLKIGDERLIVSPKKLGNSNVVVLSLENTDKELSLRAAQLEETKGNIKLIINGTTFGNI